MRLGQRREQLLEAIARDKFAILELDKIVGDALHLLDREALDPDRDDDDLDDLRCALDEAVETFGEPRAFHGAGMVRSDSLREDVGDEGADRGLLVFFAFDQRRDMRGHGIAVIVVVFIKGHDARS